MKIPINKQFYGILFASYFNKCKLLTRTAHFTYFHRILKSKSDSDLSKRVSLQPDTRIQVHICYVANLKNKYIHIFFNHFNERFFTCPSLTHLFNNLNLKF